MTYALTVLVLPELWNFYNTLCDHCTRMMQLLKKRQTLPVPVLTYPVLYAIPYYVTEHLAQLRLWMTSSLRS